VPWIANVAVADWILIVEEVQVEEVQASLRYQRISWEANQAAANYC